MSTPHPELETLAQLADPGLAILDEAELARATEHVDSCDDCGADLAALEEVRDRLAGLPAPALPPGVAANLDAVILAALTADDATHAGAITSIVTTTARMSAASSGRIWRPGRRIPTSVAAGFAVLVFAGLGTAIALGVHGSSSKSSSASAGLAAKPQFAAAGTLAPDQAVTSSGTQYTTADIDAQVTAILLSRDPSLSRFASPAPSAAASAAASAPAGAATSAAAPAFSSAAPTPLAHAAGSGLSVPGQVNNGPSQETGNALAPPASGAPAWTLAAPAALQACVDYLAGSSGTKPLLVDHASFNGSPATVITLRDPQGANLLEVFVIDDSISCESGLTYATFLHAPAGNQ